MKENKVQATAMHIAPLPAPRSEATGDLEKLFREHYDQVFRVAYRMTGSVSDAEDVLQTVFLRLARREEIYDLSPSPASYLIRAAINASLDLLRSGSRTKSVSLEDAAPLLAASPALSPEAQHEDREMRELIRRAISRLGASAAEMFVLRYLEGYDNREIALMLGTSQTVVAVVLHRARGRMRKEIGEFLEKHHEA
ncbi:MAG: sigma-70 family RNA polymerase sigma factor [Pyrinomonadaceae bacterium]|nr:sigma-70 family RNA polymerase sigma factor [Pyrinomonadaceae bacterium]